MTLNFGADPEVSAVYYKDGKPFVLSPAMMEVFCGLKVLEEDPKHPVYIREKEYSWMMDGVAWELTLLRPHTSLKNVWRVIQSANEHLGNFLSGFTYEGQQLSLLLVPTTNIEPEIYLNMIDLEKIFQGFIFGCDRDEDAIDALYEGHTIDVRTHLLRYFGGHLHTSGHERFREFPRPAIQLMALTAGNFTTANSPFPELERLRTQTYGRPGRYRLQHYKEDVWGVEYRTPSNQWTTFSEDKIEELEGWIQQACMLLGDEKKAVPLLNNFMADTCDAIVNCNQEKARNILAQIA